MKVAMNKKQTSFKRTISIMLSLLLVAGTFCFFSPFTATEAKAATPGRYEYKVSLQYQKGSYNGWDSCILRLRGKPNNGTGDGVDMVYKTDIRIADNSYTWYTQIEGDSDIFPYQINYNYSARLTFKVIFKLEVRKKGEGNWTELPLYISRSDMYGTTWQYNEEEGCVEGDRQGFEATGNTGGNVWATVREGYYKGTYYYPKANTVVWQKNHGTYTVPTPTEANVSLNTAPGATVYDQYGVEWYKEPQYAVKENSLFDLPGDSIPGVSIQSEHTDSAVLTVTNEAKEWVCADGGTDRAFYVFAHYGDIHGGWMKITLQNYIVDVNFRNRDNSLIEVKQIRYGMSVDPPDDPNTPYDDTCHYVFSGWDKNPAKVTDEHANVVAQYNAVPHTYSESDYVAPTCKDLGSVKKTCECGRSYTDEIPVTDTHTPLDPVRENEIPATCKDEGSYDEVVYCGVCGEELSRTQKTIPVTDTHTPLDPVRENEVPATCKDEGSYDEVVYCGVCGEELSRENKTIPALSCEKTRLISFENIDSMHYVLDNDGEEYIVNKSSTIEWYTDKPLTFTVYTYSDFGYATVTVKINGERIEPDENGVYTVPAGTDPATVTIEGAAKDDNGSKLSFCEKLCRFFKKIMAFFSKIFCGSFGSFGGSNGA